MKLHILRSKVRVFADTLLFVFLGLGIVHQQAQALTVVQGAGNITFVDSDLAGAGIDVGDAFTFEIAVDDTMADILTSTSSSGYYPDSIQYIDFVIDGTALNFSGGDTRVDDTSSDAVAFNSFAADQTTAVPDINGFSFQRVNMVFDNSDILSDDSLEGSLNNLDAFADADFYFDYGNNILRGDVTSVTISAGSGLEIPDPNLRSALEETLGLNPGDPITQAEMEGLTSLDLTFKGIVDLTGLEYAINLTSLMIPGNSINDLGPLQALTQLRTLIAMSNDISDLTPLGSLTELRFLILDNNPVGGLAPLGTLTNLEQLSLTSAGISDLSGLETLTQLRFLLLSANQISDLTPLQALTGLSHLQLHTNEITDLTPLSGLSNLQYLDLGGNQATAAAGLGTLTSLIELDVSKNQLQNISALAELTPAAAPDLRMIWLHDNLLADVSALSGLSQLANVNDPWFGSYPPDNANAPGLRLELNALDIADGSATRTEVIDPLQAIAGLDVLYAPQKTPAFEVPQTLVELYGLEGDLLTVEIEVLNTGSASFVLSLSDSPAWVSLVGEPVTVSAHSSALVTLSVGPLPVITEPLQAEITFQSTDALASAETVMLDIFEGRMIEIPDAALRQTIYSILRLEDDDILTQSLIEGLTSMGVYGTVEDLTGLEYAINLSTLILGGIPAADLSPVLNLPALRSLSLTNLGLETVPDLQNLSELQFLSLANNNIQTLDGLIGLPNLARLILSGNPITSFEALQGRSLDELSLTGSGLQTLDGLTSLTVSSLNLLGNSLTSTQGLPQSVNRVNLSYNMISDLTGLAGLSLADLDLSNNQVTDLTPLETVTVGSNLNLSNNLISDLFPITGMTGLWTLDLSNNSIESISGFEAWNSLRTLNLVGNPLSGTVDLTGFSGLRDLNVTGAQMTVVPDLTGLVNLRSLNIRQTQITSLVGVAELPALTLLDAGGSRLQNLDGLSAFPSLSTLRAGSNDLTDITGLQEVPQLITADLWGNTIQTVPDLSSHADLQFLYLGRNDLTQLSGINAPALEVLDIRENGLTTLADLGPQPNLKTLDASSNLLESIDLNPAHVPALTRISLWSNRISDLSGLANLPNLTGELNLRWNQITTLDTLPTSGLPGVSGLNLQDNPLQSLQGIGSLSSLSTLNISGTGIIDLTGIEGATGLTTLSASSNQITDITPLQSLPNLSSLNVGGNQLQDLSPIANLPLTFLRADDNQLTSLPVLNTTLTYLGLKKNQLTDITPLAELFNLSTLQLSDNLIQDLNPLSNIGTLNRLEINNNQLTSLDGLANSLRLTWLYANGNQLTNISAVQGLPELYHLNLGDNQITTLAGLENLPALDYLVLSGNLITSLVGMGPLENLRTLILGDNQIQNISSFPSLPRLSFLDLSSNQISDFSPIASLPALGRLTISHNPVGSGLATLSGATGLTILTAESAAISTIVGVEMLTSLENLNLNENSITDVTPLTELPVLGSLRIDGNPISDFTPLGGLGSLRLLSIQNTGVSDLSFLASSKALITLWADQNAITDLTPLANLPQLANIHVNDNFISDISSLSGLNLRELIISGNTVSNLSPISGQANLSSLDVSNNAISDISTIATLERLRSFRAEGNQIQIVPDLRHLKELRFVNLSNNLIQNPGPLAGIPAIATLQLENNLINDLSGFIGDQGANQSLDFLVLSNNLISDISVLSELTQTQLVWLDGNRISDPSVLADFVALKDSTQYETGTFHWNLIPGQNWVSGLRLQNNYIDISAGSDMLALLEDMNGRADLTVEYEPQYAPDLLVLQPEISLVGEAGGSYVQLLNLRNNGTGNLEYDIAFPPEATWLSTAQTSGTIPELGSVDITLEFTSLPAFDKVLEAEVIISTNEPGGSDHIVPVRVVGIIPNPDYSSAPGDFALIEAGPQWRTEVRDGAANGAQLVGTYRPDAGGWVPYIWDPVNGIRDAPQIPGAIIRDNFFTLVQKLAEEAQLAVGRTFDEFGNLVPVVWSLEEPLAPPTILPLPDGLDRSGFSNGTLGRAFDISKDGSRISGQALNGSGFLEGIIWDWDPNTVSWIIAERTGDLSIQGWNFLEIYPYEMSDNSEIVIGWASFFDLNFSYMEFPFIWTNDGIEYFPLPVNAMYEAADLISANGQTAYGQYYDSNLEETRMIIWELDPVSGTWTYADYAYPAGFQSADFEAFINDNTPIVSMSLLTEEVPAAWRSYIFDPANGFIPSRDWVLDKFGLDFGPDWEGDVTFANPATGILFGKLSPYHSNRYQWIGFRYDRFGDVQNSLSDAPFISDLPLDKQGPEDTNGPLSISNELAYALGLHPLHVSQADMPQQVIEELGGNQFVSLTSPYNENATDVEVIAEVSSTMLEGDWQQDPTNVEIIRDGNGNLIARDLIPFSPDNPRFIRLRVVPAE
jgi:internalin A